MKLSNNELFFKALIKKLKKFSIEELNASLIHNFKVYKKTIKLSIDDPKFPIKLIKLVKQYDDNFLLVQKLSQKYLHPFSDNLILRDLHFYQAAINELIDEKYKVNKGSTLYDHTKL